MFFQCEDMTSAPGNLIAPASPHCQLHKGLQPCSSASYVVYSKINDSEMGGCVGEWRERKRKIQSGNLHRRSPRKYARGGERMTVDPGKGRGKGGIFFTVFYLKPDRKNAFFVT